MYFQPKPAVILILLTKYCFGHEFLCKMDMAVAAMAQG